MLFAQALLAKPPLIIMDEPTNGLDPYWMIQLAQLLQQLRKDGHSVIFSTHQLDIADSDADHILFLNNGQNVGEGRLPIYVVPVDRFTAHFIIVWVCYHHAEADNKKLCVI
ncbi:AAA family ATPase [Paenibacillus dokdonensis]|uniref:AAA family ATPase n=1 Tax=Paenibacillus dokdonensis TaxID=2567944 RepID=UPI002DB91CC8|nr:AAA family ATPase [Paenibacillus dokdonensis]